jgi:hypothetical protein
VGAVVFARRRTYHGPISVPVQLDLGARLQNKKGGGHCDNMNNIIAAASPRGAFGLELAVTVAHVGRQTVILIDLSRASPMGLASRPESRNPACLVGPSSVRPGPAKIGPLQVGTGVWRRMCRIHSPPPSSSVHASRQSVNMAR